MADLFSFLDVVPDDDFSNNIPDLLVTETRTQTSKHKTDVLDPPPEEFSAEERLGKKLRLEAPLAPLVLDDFQTETKREVSGSTGSLAGTEAGVHLELRHQVVRHQVAVPHGYNYRPLTEHIPPAKPDRGYQFELDAFEKVSVMAIQRNESVLMSAHTGAGRTVVAEYAIAQCLNRKQRIIYTSPIKALSNQKYRDMLAVFGDVGLMTGDVTINPSATCLVMTTEILRSMLYRGFEFIHGVAWVIFDEIYRMVDKRQYAVWEETIILLPHTVRYIFLAAATIPNAMQFAEWICQSHDQPCHVVRTDFRPTPLQHYLFPARGEDVFMVVNEKGEFREDNFNKAMAQLIGPAIDNHEQSQVIKEQGQSNTRGENDDTSDIAWIVKRITQVNYQPMVVFSFSKYECESHSIALAKHEFNSTDEQAQVRQIFTNAIDCLSQDDRQLPEIVNFLPLLCCGIGLHHSGLLPIIREVIEILFQEGLIKVLFATETFLIGLNMPAKTIVFTGTDKFDGRERRKLTSGEYIQMSGRAGCRGLDDRGVVVMMCDEKLEPTSVKGMIMGEANRLESAFHLGYRMIMNVMTVEGSPECMLERSFFHFQSRAEIPHLESELRKEEERARSIRIEDEAAVAHYYDIRLQLDQLIEDARTVITHPVYALRFVGQQLGRLMQVKHKSIDFGWGIALNYHKRVSPRHQPIPTHEQYVINVLLNCAPEVSDRSIPQDGPSMTATPNGVMPCPPGIKGAVLIVPVLLSAMNAISRLRVDPPDDLLSESARQTAWEAAVRACNRFPDGVPLLDPIEHMGITDEKFRELLTKIGSLEDEMHQSSLKDSRLPGLCALYSEKMEVKERIRALETRIQSTLDVSQNGELKARKRVLQILGFTTAADAVDVKGRVACEISIGDEVLLTELLFNGVFTSLEPEYCAALLSCIAFDEKSERQSQLGEDLVVPLRSMQEVARRIAKVVKESGLALEEEAYVKSFKSQLMEAVLRWCRRASFFEVGRLTDVYEGSLVRLFRRLDELLRQMAQAAHVIGDAELKAKFKAASELIKRPNSVVFCSSLYLQDTDCSLHSAHSDA